MHGAGTRCCVSLTGNLLLYRSLDLPLHSVGPLLLGGLCDCCGLIGLLVPLGLHASQMHLVVLALFNDGEQFVELAIAREALDCLGLPVAEPV